MAQIAQQEDLIIEVPDRVSAMGEDIKKKVIECIENGTIGSVVFKQTDGNGNDTPTYFQYTKVLAYKKDITAATPKYKITVLNVNGSQLETVALN